MPRNDPKFVRLPDRLISGCLGDTDGSYWFIGGRDVKPFPSEDEPLAQNYVRDHLSRGNLESASKAEYDAVQEALAEMANDHLNQLDTHEAHDRDGHQEQRLQTIAARTQTKLDRLRAKSKSDDEEEEQVEGEETGVEARSPARRQGGRGNLTGAAPSGD